MNEEDEFYVTLQKNDENEFDLLAAFYDSQNVPCWIENHDKQDCGGDSGCQLAEGCWHYRLIPQYARYSLMIWKFLLDDECSL